MDANGYSDPFVRLFLHPSVGKKTKYKTSVRKKTLNPEFNEFYAGRREEPARRTPLLSVCDYHLGTANDFTGRVHVSWPLPPSRQGAAEWPGQRGAPAALEGAWATVTRLELWLPLDGSAPLQLSD